MIPWKLIISIQDDCPVPVYLQIANNIIREIKSGILKPNLKLPGSRVMAETLNVHRKTIVNAYDELDAQGWLVMKPYSGTFISEHLPEVTPQKFSSVPYRGGTETTGYKIKPNPLLQHASRPMREIPGFHDGPDMRLVPVAELSRACRSVLTRKAGLINLSYVDAEGRYSLRKVLSEDMNLARGMHTTPENIFISRGSQMAIYMLSLILIEKDDIVLMAEIDFYYAYRTFQNAGARLVRVPIDEDGIDVDEIEKICKRRKVRALYVTPHHHYPTTVTLSAARRMKLLALSEKYGFIIIEDDYDYEFHYESNPILPLASADNKGMIVYIGTLSKTIAPAIRIGYVTAPQNLIAELTQLRQIIDSQGDPLMEQAVAELFTEGEIRRHMKKALKEYRIRRDHMCGILQDRFSDSIHFKTPDGGLSVWAQFDKKIKVPEISVKMREKGFIMSSGLIHNITAERKLNATRLGFGWMNVKEATKALDILYKTIYI